jgi:plastocyanin
VLLIMLLGLMAVGGPASAAAQSFRVQLDATAPDKEPWQFNRIFPVDYLTVHQGDEIQAQWGGPADIPHTSTLVNTADPDTWRQDNQGAGGTYALVVPDQSAGGDDANEAVINPNVLFPTSTSCGSSTTPCSFDGSAIVSSGFTFNDPANQPSFFFTVNAPVGQYTLLCLVHPGMQTAIFVAPPTQGIQTPQAVATRVTNQIGEAKRVDGEAADEEAQKVRRTRVGAHSRFTIQAGGFVNQVSANEYPNAGLKLHVGDQLKVVGAEELHTATFPKSSVKTTPFIITQCEQPGADKPASSPAECSDPSKFQAALNGKAIAPTTSSKLVRPAEFVNAGLLADPSASFIFTASKPGIYAVVCLVHGPTMSTTVTIVG